LEPWECETGSDTWCTQRGNAKNPAELLADAKVLHSIDGLDEYEESISMQSAGLAEEILSLAELPNVMIVVASRPEPSSVRRFSGRSSMRLQDLTKGDIVAYVESEIRQKMRPESFANHGINVVGLSGCCTL
jgi:hypothetical protein